MTPKEMIELLKSRVPGQKIANFIIKNPRAGIGWQAPLKLAESHLVLIERADELVESEEKAWQAVAKMWVDLGTTDRLRLRAKELEERQQSDSYFSLPEPIPLTPGCPHGVIEIFHGGASDCQECFEIRKHRHASQCGEEEVCPNKACIDGMEQDGDGMSSVCGMCDGTGKYPDQGGEEKS